MTPRYPVRRRILPLPLIRIGQRSNHPFNRLKAAIDRLKQFQNLTFKFTRIGHDETPHATHSALSL